MVRVVLWINLSWKNGLDNFYSMIMKLASLYARAICSLLSIIHYRRILKLFRILRFCLPARRHDVLLHKVANENKRCLLGEKSGKIDHIWLNQRRRLLELAATYGTNQGLLQELESCSQQLNAIVEPLHRDGHPVVLAPLHMVSDVLAGIVASKVCPGHATIIVSSSAEQFLPENRFPIAYCSIHEDQHQIASRLMASLNEAVEHKTNIVLFPDITPEFTAQDNISGSAKSKHRLFGRSAHLHSGIIRLSRMMSAKVVFFNLYYDDGVKIAIQPPVSHREVKSKIAEIIEQSISNYPDEWLLWHTHSLFFFNE